MTGEESELSISRVIADPCCGGRIGESREIVVCKSCYEACGSGTSITESVS